MKTRVVVYETSALALQTMVIVIRMKGFNQLQSAFAHRTIGVGTQVNGLNAFIGVVHDACWGRAVRKTLVVPQLMDDNSANTMLKTWKVVCLQPVITDHR